jgi:hypothetical protein
MPAHVRFSTRWYRYNNAYWVRIDRLTPGALASVDAVRNGNDVRVVTQNIDALTILAPVRTLTVDGVAVKVRAGAEVSLIKSGGRWAAGVTPAGGKQAGLEGPIADAVRTRHLWVYGTAGAASEEELSRRRAEAESAATWSTARLRLYLPAVVKADRDVTDSDIAGANLMLFGTAGTNTLIARYAPQLPMALSPGAADYGLVFVAPVGGRYVVVSSGLPWWTGADEANRGGYRFAPDKYRLMSTFGDYLVYKGGVKNVLADGLFDRDWRLPADQAERLRATGVITIRP